MLAIKAHDEAIFEVIFNDTGKPKKHKKIIKKWELWDELTGVSD
jgi:hypothetical protein